MTPFALPPELHGSRHTPLLLGWLWQVCRRYNGQTILYSYTLSLSFPMRKSYLMQ